MKQISLILLFLFSISLFAEEEDLPDASIDVNLNIVSNYVFRGMDQYHSRAKARNQKYGPHTGAAAFQPNITWNTPVDGLYFNLWTSFALQGREDVDVDNGLQICPAGAGTGVGNYKCGGDILADQIYSALKFDETSLLGERIQDEVRAAAQAVALLGKSDLEGYQTATGGNGPPGFYREPVGLKRLDEIDLTLGYSRETKVGTIGGGVVTYGGANTLGRNTFGNWTELFASYSLPQLPQLSVTVFTRAISSPFYTYYNLKWSDSIDIDDDSAIFYYSGIGYETRDNLQGIKDVTSGVGYDWNGFNFGVNVAYRPNLAFQELEMGSGDLNTRLPIQYNGKSTLTDGLVPDPSKQYDLTTVVLNKFYAAAIQEVVLGSGFVSPFSSYTYEVTPRVKLPKYVYWFNIGYTEFF